MRDVDRKRGERHIDWTPLLCLALSWLFTQVLSYLIFTVTLQNWRFYADFLHLTMGNLGLHISGYMLRARVIPLMPTSIQYCVQIYFVFTFAILWRFLILPHCCPLFSKYSVSVYFMLGLILPLWIKSCAEAELLSFLHCSLSLPSSLPSLFSFPLLTLLLHLCHLILLFFLCLKVQVSGVGGQQTGETIVLEKTVCYSFQGAWTCGSEGRRSKGNTQAKPLLWFLQEQERKN